MIMEARSIYHRVLARMRLAGDEEGVARLSADRENLCDADFLHFAAEMGCALEIDGGGGGAPFSAFYGAPRPVGLRVRRMQNRDGAGHLAWYYEILDLWRQCDAVSRSGTAAARSRGGTAGRQGWARSGGAAATMRSSPAGVQV